ncbi:MAG TPA: hypothetical protein VEV41_09780 [Terriglobales bacterium]|nr:hypothetical protein [Terriglobales bacterium]
MEQRATGNPAGSTSNVNSAAGVPRREGRNVWILTIYGISGLALFGILAYYFSSYIAH